MVRHWLGAEAFCDCQRQCHPYWRNPMSPNLYSQRENYKKMNLFKMHDHQEHTKLS